MTIINRQERDKQVIKDFLSLTVFIVLLMLIVLAPNGLWMAIDK